MRRPALWHEFCVGVLVPELPQFSYRRSCLFLLELGSPCWGWGIHLFILFLGFVIDLLFIKHSMLYLSQRNFRCRYCPWILLVYSDPFAKASRDGEACCSFRQFSSILNPSISMPLLKICSAAAEALAVQLDIFSFFEGIGDAVTQVIISYRCSAVFGSSFSILVDVRIVEIRKYILFRSFSPSAHIFFSNEWTSLRYSHAAQP
jgi:hypothetical protein